MPSSYIYLGGTLTLSAAIGASGSVQVEFSGNNGLWIGRRWRPTARRAPKTLDLTSRVYRATTTGCA
jgi:hypothetical protein